MGRKLFVGGLPWSTTDEELHAAFAAHGTVTSANVVKDRETGRSRGFGFVEYETDEMAAKAIEIMNETDIGGRRIRVNEATPRGAGGGGYRSGRGYL